MKVLVVGAGAMGRWFTKYFRERGWEVEVYDILEERAMSLASEAGGKAVSTPGLVIAVPIRVTPKALREHGPRAKVVVEISSVKAKVLKEARSLKNVISIHPLFGPGLSKPENGKAILVPVIDGRREEKVVSSLFPFKIMVMDASLHDRLMAWLAIAHGVLNSFLSSTSQLSEYLVEVAPTTVMALLKLSGASLKQSSSLTEELVRENPYFKEEFLKFLNVLKEFSERPQDVIEGARKWMGIIDPDRCYEDLYRFLMGQ